MTTVLSDQVVKARKRHCCDQCMRSINLGEMYRRQTYVEDRLINTYKAHDDCDAAAQRYAELADLHPLNDDPPRLVDDLGRDDWWWLLDEFPCVADRFGVQGPPRS
jgi:hypothetical protein